MTTNGNQQLPMEGIRILDATHIIAGPFCAMILADMGAEVIKIERPGNGDRSRHNHPFIQNPDGEDVSARFLGVNRNKKSVTMDLRDETCRRAFEEMVKVSDVLLDNWGPGAFRRLGLGYDYLRELNPGLIYASITGYGDGEGLRGPYSEWAANNPCVQGMGGWMQITGSPDGPPQMVGDNIGDSVPGVWTALGVMFALESRRKTGLGQHVDMSMYDCMVSHMTSSMPHFQATKEISGRARENMFTAQLALEASDGFVVLAGSGGEGKWEALWSMIGREELISDTRYLGKGVTGEFYFNNVVPAIEQWSKLLPKQEVNKQLLACGFSMGIVQDAGDIDRCPHLEQRNMFLDSGDGYGGNFRTINTPIQLTGCVNSPTGAPPKLGQHNREILSSIGGLSEAELAALESEGKI
ncbi:MAG: CoA transferase [SAR202 cluster bacterium]|jgi:CoA:oxalate CoA-transferase|nr:MAG: CoA transferase [SAR202 cluster bacterium]